jgi:hypothetical protein
LTLQDFSSAHYSRLLHPKSLSEMIAFITVAGCV